MFDIAFLDEAAYWVNLAYIVLVCLTLATSVVVVFISHQRSALGGTDVERVQRDSEARIAAANQQSAEANQRAAALNAEAAQAQARAAAAALAEAQLRKENLQLAAELEREKNTRLQIEQKAAQQRAVPPPASQQAPAPQPSAQQPAAQQPSAQQPSGQKPPAPAAEAQNPPPSAEPRVLSAPQEEYLLSDVRQFAQKRVTVMALGDSEAGSLARQIASVLEKAGWQVFISPVGALVPPQYGVICTHNAGDAAAAALVAALRSANLIVYDRTETVDQVQLIVGLKPQ